MTSPSVDKRLLLIGESRGLGFALAEEYLKRGWHVVATERLSTKSQHMVYAGLGSNGYGRSWRAAQRPGQHTEPCQHDRRSGRQGGFNTWITWAERSRGNCGVNTNLGSGAWFAQCNRCSYGRAPG